MASTIGLLRAKLNLDAAGFRQGLERAQSATATFQKKMRRAEYRMKRFGRQMESTGRTMTMGLTAPILGAAGVALRSAAKFESLGVQMEVLTGSAQAGARAFRQLKQFSARTPFQLQDLTKAQNTLMGFGLEAEDAFQHLQRLGDVAAVTGGDLQAISVAFGQAAAEGKLMTRDIRQLINQGVPAIKLLAESMGVAQSEVLDLAEQGEISFDVLTKAFEDATKSGGQFANGTERLADTLEGTWSTLKDNVSLALAEMGNEIANALDIKDITKNLSAQLGNITQNFKNLSSESKIQILKIAGLLAAGGPLLLALGKAAQAIAAFSKFVRGRFILVVGAIGVVGTTIQWLADNWGISMDNMELSLKKMKNAATTLFGPIGTAAAWVGEQIINLGKKVGSFVADTASDLINFGKDSKAFTSWAESAENFKNNLKDLGEEILQFGADKSGLDELLDLLRGTGGGPGGGGDIAAPSLATAGLSQGIDNISRSLETMRAKGAETGTVTQVAMRGVKDRIDEANIAAQMFGEKLGDVLSQAVLHGKDLIQVVQNLIKQLASRAFITGIGMLLNPAASFGGGSFFKNMFGFAQGGRPTTHKVALVGERGPELFVPDTAGAIVPLSPSRNNGIQNIHITGRLVGEGSDLVAVIKHAEYGTLR